MAAQQERPRENNIVYELKTRQALEVARERTHTKGLKVVSFQDLVDGINSQIPPQEIPDIYKAYGIDGSDLKMKAAVMTAKEEFDHWQLNEAQRTNTEPQFSPRVQRAIQYAEEFAALKQNQTLDITDLFRGTVKVVEDDFAALRTLSQNSIL